MVDKEYINALYRKARQLFYRFLDPFDHLFLRINKLGVYPPLSLRRHASGLGFIDGSGMEHYAYLKLIARLEHTSRVLDIGCGCGLLELAFEKIFWKGTLIGIDIHKPSIAWCKKTIAKRNPSFSFYHADIYNSAYWRKGKYDAKTWFTGFQGTNFDLIIAKSLFTHMLPDETKLYFQEISNRLKKGGTAFLTFFFLNKEQEKMQSLNNTDIIFTKMNNTDVYAVRKKIAPTSAIGYDEIYIMNLLKANNLALIKPVYYGSWTGKRNSLSYQDIVITEKI